MQYYSTADVPRRERLDYWNGLTSDNLLRMEVNALEKGSFDGEIYWENIGPVSIAKAASSTAELRRTRSHISHADERIFLVNLTESGSFRLQQRGREAVLYPGDFALSDSSEPFAYCHNDPCGVIVLRIPENLMKSYIPVPEDFVGRAVNGKEGLGEVASVMLRTLAAQMQRGLSDQFRPGMVYAVLEIMASAYTGNAGRIGVESDIARLRRNEIKNYIETNLMNPELSPREIAAALKMSTRYMRMVFSGHGERVSEYILRRRLEETARRLRDPLWQNRTISEIAFNWGFNSLGSFERAFKQQYGLPPGEFKRREGLSRQKQALN